jgi:hypothetical protein
MGLKNSREEFSSETINWNNIKTENISSTLPNFNGLSKDAKQLIASLNIPSITESEISESNLNNILEKINSKLDTKDKQKFNRLVNQSNNQSEELSATSPFISSEAYGQLVNSKTSESELQMQQKGGAKKKKSKQPNENVKVKKSKKSKKSMKKVGGQVDKESSTSSTTTVSSTENIIDSSEGKILEKNKVKNHKNKENYSENDSDTNLSYLSSSAHTGGEFSDSPEDGNTYVSSSAHSSSEKLSQSDSSNQTDSQEPTTVSNDNNFTGLDHSVNTSDINMVTESD